MAWRQDFRRPDNVGPLGYPADSQDNSAHAAGPKRGLRDVMSADAWTVACVFLLCTLYAVLHLSPSSYSIVLARYFGVAQADTGLLWGQPQDIRYDEHSVLTPTIQTCERNENRRYNATSPYGEDLVGALSLPIRDATLIFRPYFLVSVFGDPALGYSCYWASWYFLFLAGYFLLFRCFRVGTCIAILGTAALFATSYVQLWWTTFAPILSIMPWMFLVLQSRLHGAVKLGLATYTVTAWILAFPYPGLNGILLVLVAAMLWSHAADLRHRIEHVVMLAAASVIACGISFWHLKDWVAGLARTDLAHRSVSGGSVTASTMASYLYPPFAHKRFEALIPPNACEVSSVGSLILVGAILYCTPSLIRHVRSLWCLSVFSAVLLCWMVLPIPSIVGKALLLDKTFPVRLSFAFGLPLFILALRAFDQSPFVPKSSRLIALAGFFAAAIAAKCWLFGYPLPGIKSEAAIAVAACVLVAAVHLASRHYEGVRRHGHVFLLAAFVVPSAAYFIGFNPIQSTRPMFVKPQTTVTENLDRLQAANPKGWLVVNGFQGGVLNGQGYRSVTHTLYNPQPSFFADIVRDMTPEEFDDTFNRWGYIVVETSPKLRKPMEVNGQVIFVPERYFTGGNEGEP